MRRHIAAGTNVDVFDIGRGPAVLVLHDELGLETASEWLQELAKQKRVIAPVLPGFGSEDIASWINHPSDLAFLILQILDQLEIHTFDLIGLSFGGWVAAEIASMSPERILGAVFCGPYGVKTGPIDKLDIPDIFAIAAHELKRLSWYDQTRYNDDIASMSDDELRLIARRQETFTLLGWEPFLHNPKLRHRLHRLTAPSLFIRGAHDGIISAEYLERYAALLPNAMTCEVMACGHFPHREQPRSFAAAVSSHFLRTSAPAAVR
jgi:pimeloyl-ACP methyl ester carboxylesterase